MGTSDDGFHHIGGYVLHNLNQEALELFDEMCEVGECPDEVTMLSLLSACADLGDWGEGACQDHGVEQGEVEHTFGEYFL